jgi:hypothetical protein
MRRATLFPVAILPVIPMTNFPGQLLTGCLFDNEVDNYPILMSFLEMSTFERNLRSVFLKA